MIKEPRRRAAAPPGPAGRAAPLPLGHPAFWFAVLVCAAIVALSVTHDLFDPDTWQHLTVGRFIWERHHFPTTQLWTWPTYGAKEVDYAWGFEALIWPFWKLGGLFGLYLWRWLTTLAAFGLAWAAARRMGARGLAPLVVIALGAMIYRGRSQVRPETVAAVLLMAEVWLLESRRHGARPHPAWLVAIAWVWANTHISYYLFFVVLGLHLLAALLPPRRAGAPPVRELWLAGLTAAAISFVNPSGWRTLWQPFEFWLTWRHETIYQNIGEMRPVDWAQNTLNGLPLLLGLWPLLALARARWLPRAERAGPGLDRVEALMCLVFTATLLVGGRFMGVYALVAAVYVGRDLDEWARRVRLPRALAAPWARAGLAAAACVLVAWPEMSRTASPVRMRIPSDQLPVFASDFIQRHDIHGHGFNQYELGGYLGFRFWPRRDQLPFMGIHQEGSQDLRRLYQAALSYATSWRELNDRYRLDYLVLLAQPVRGDSTLAFADRDSSWVRVFGDDVTCVYVRRDGVFARLAADSGYRVLPAFPGAMAAFGERTTRDPELRREAERELERVVAGSPAHALALGYLANIALFEARWDDARRDLEQALRVAPVTLGVREKLGVLALQQGRPREALRWFEAERRVLHYHGGLSFRRGQVAQAEGDLRRALALYRREAKRETKNREVRDSVESLSRRLGE